MIPKNRVPTHPGEILLEEFLIPMKLSQVKFAAHIGVPVQRINEIVRGKRGITPETAWLFSQAFGTTPQDGRVGNTLEFKFEVRHSWPNHSFQRTQTAALFGPLNSDR